MTKGKISAQAGLTLIELLTVVALAAILAAVGIPGMRTMNENIQATATTNALVSAIFLARSEAAKRGQAVSICAASESDSAVCASGEYTQSWDKGWLVFVDSTGNPGKLDTGDVLIRQFPSVDERYRVMGSSAFVSYLSTGLLASSPVNWELRNEHCDSQNHRDIQMSAIGRPHVSHASEIDC